VEGVAERLARLLKAFGFKNKVLYRQTPSSTQSPPMTEWRKAGSGEDKKNEAPH